MKGITRADIILFVILLLASPLWILCGLLTITLLAICWLLSLLTFGGSISALCILIIVGAGYPFFIVTQLSGLAFTQLLRERSLPDNMGFSFHRSFRKKTVLWKDIKKICLIWTPPIGLAFQFHLNDGKSLKMTVTEETMQLISQAIDLGIPIEENHVSKRINERAHMTSPG